jgi:predicted XRE-type DNA-binding protein
MTRKHPPRGTDNVLVEPGFDDAEELSVKAALALKLNELVEKRGRVQPEDSQLRRYKLQNISLERLMQALVSLDQRVEITVQPARRAPRAGCRHCGGGLTPTTTARITSPS